MVTNVKKYLSPVQVETKESGLPLVDCIYLINLEKCPQKWQRVKSICDGFGLKINRFNAINGWKLNRRAIDDLCQYDDGKDGYKFFSDQRSFSKGHLGCFLSHLSIIHDAYQRGFQVIWTMEDDVDFFQDVKILPNFISDLTRLDPEWDIFYTDLEWGGNTGSKASLDFVSSWLKTIPPGRLRPGQPRKDIAHFLQRTTFGPFVKIHYRWGTHSLLFSRKGMKKIIDYFNQYRYYVSIDIDFHFIPDMREYALQEDVTGIKKSESNTSYSPSPWKRPFRKAGTIILTLVKPFLRPIYRKWVKPLVKKYTPRR